MSMGREQGEQLTLPVSRPGIAQFRVRNPLAVLDSYLIPTQHGNFIQMTIELKLCFIFLLMHTFSRKKGNLTSF